jgi:hypothetical protein
LLADGCVMEEDLAHIFGKQLAKVLRVGRNQSPLVPLNDQSLPQRLASVCDANDSQNIAIGARTDGMIATPCPASASASKVWGASDPCRFTTDPHDNLCI